MFYKIDEEGNAIEIKRPFEFILEILLDRMREVGQLCPVLVGVNPRRCSSPEYEWRVQNMGSPKLWASIHQF